MSEDLYVKTTNDNLEIRNIDDAEFCYFIRKVELPLKRDGNLSEWIMQLMDKSWMTIGALYRIAKTIQQEFPGNTIDWYNTFYIVEKANYLKSVGDVLLAKDKSLTDTLIQDVEFGMKETTLETDEIIDRIVSQRLYEFEI